MKVAVEFEVGVPPAQAAELMQSGEFLERLASAIDLVEGIEELERRENASRFTRTLRYTARTKLPKFLKRYEGKAPERVRWEERGEWTEVDGGGAIYRYQIVPEVPEHWRDYYENNGLLRIVPVSTGSRVSIAFEYGVKIPVFGMSNLVERALKGEVERILVTQGEVLRRMA